MGPRLRGDGKNGSGGKRLSALRQLTRYMGMSVTLIKALKLTSPRGEVGRASVRVRGSKQDVVDCG